MNNNYIAVIDSGVGGLHILQSLVKLFPNEKFLFLADEAFFPYGIKTKEDLENRLTNITKKLLSFNIKALVIACNTASAASSHLKKITNIPIIEIIGVTASYALSKTENKRIGLWATNGTINSECYQQILNKDAKCYPVVASDLVVFIENDQIETIECKARIIKYLNDIEDSDCLILGCTHFPLLSNLIHSIKPNIKLISSNQPVAEKLEQVLRNSNLENQDEFLDKVIIYTTCPNLTLKEKIKRFDITYTKIDYLEIE